MTRANSHYKKALLLLFALEGIVYWATVLLGGFLFFNGAFYPGQYLVIQLCMALGLYAFRAYDPGRLRNPFEGLAAAIEGGLFGGLLSVALLMTQFPRIPRHFFIPVFLAYWGASLVGRLLWPAWFGKNAPATSAWVIGSSSWKELLLEISKGLGMPFEPLTFLSPKEASSMVERKETIGGIGGLLIVADPETLLVEGFHRKLKSLASGGASVELLPNLAERALNRIPLSVATAFNTHYEVVFNALFLDPSQRILDMVVSFVFLVLLSPLMLLIACSIVLESGVPIFFIQERVGLDGKPYRMHKFRTMRPRTNETGSGAPTFANVDEGRITRVGRVLRKTRLDELPQLWDVLRGKMSLVGPRPEQPLFVERFCEAIPFYDYRHEARPGITGWAQINYDYAYDLEGTKRKLEYDLYYVKHRSLMFDIQILLQTIEIMLGGRGAL